MKGRHRKVAYEKEGAYVYAVKQYRETVDQVLRAKFTKEQYAEWELLPDKERIPQEYLPDNEHVPQKLVL